MIRVKFSEQHVQEQGLVGDAFTQNAVSDL